MNKVGNIVLLNNVLFKNSDGMYYPDHAWNKGRPSIIISESNDHYYMITRSTKCVSNRNQYILTPEMAEYDNKKYNVTTNVSITPFIERPICAYPIIGDVYQNYYLKLLEYIIYFCNNYENKGEKEKYPFLLEDINNQILKLKK